MLRCKTCPRISARRGTPPQPRAASRPRFARHRHASYGTAYSPDGGSLSVNQFKWTVPVKITLPGGSVQEKGYDGLLNLENLKAKIPGQQTVLSLQNSYGNPLRFIDPRGLDNVGCTTDPLIIDGRCKRICCAIHDKCYDDNDCAADSWTNDRGCNAKACDKCNKDVVKCFVWCDQAEPMGIKPAPGTPEYYCPAQHQYIKIPGDFQNVEAAKTACGTKR